MSNDLINVKWSRRLIAQVGRGPRLLYVQVDYYLIKKQKNQKRESWCLLPFFGGESNAVPLSLHDEAAAVGFGGRPRSQPHSHPHSGCTSWTKCSHLVIAISTLGVFPYLQSGLIYVRLRKWLLMFILSKVIVDIFFDRDRILFTVQNDDDPSAAAHLVRCCSIRQRKYSYS
jgi:hypothetical protein